MLAVYIMPFLATLCITPLLASETFDNPSWTSLQLALWPSLEFPNTRCTVYGLSLGLVAVGAIEEGKQAPEFPACRGEDDIVGLQIGGLFTYGRELHGLQASGWRNNAVNMPAGIQVAGFGNSVEHDMGLGLQVCCFKNQCESGAGLQFAILNRAHNDFSGIQVGVCNFGEGKSKWVEKSRSRLGDHVTSYGHHSDSNEGVGDMRGLQLGLMNKALAMYGSQCGVIWNYAEHASGLQIGFVNIADTMTGIQIGLVNIITENPVLFLPIINAHF